MSQFFVDMPISDLKNGEIAKQQRARAPVHLIFSGSAILAVLRLLLVSLENAELM